MRLIKNNSGSSKVWVGQTIANGASYQIEATELIRWQNDGTVLTALAGGTAVMNDGDNDLSAAAGLQFLLGVKAEPRDVTGRPITRAAITQEGWGAQFHAISFKVGEKDSVYNKNEAGTDLGFTTLKFYDSSDVEQTTQENITANAVKTALTWMPNHDYDIIGGQLNQIATPASNLYMYATGLPGILDKKFAEGGMNLRLSPIGTVIDFDGKASMFLPYNGGAGTNKFKFTFKHGTGVTHELQFILKIFKG